MKRIFCLADNIISPLGEGTAANVRAVLEGKSGIRRYEAGAFGASEPFCASFFDRDMIPAGDGTLFERVLKACVKSAVEETGIDPASPRVLFLLSTTKGNITEIGRNDADLPLDVPARRLASFFGNPNPPLVVSNACISGLAALIQARRLLLAGRYDHLVVAGAEIHSLFTISGFQSLKALSASPCKPFDKDRDGLNLGEAAACIVLSAAEVLPERAWEPVCGVVRNDANHISGPSRTAEGSYNCLRAVLPYCSKEELAMINVHGTSTLYNDEMESIALHRAELSDIPVNALKSCFGHTMGAAGILEAIISMHCLDEGFVPATIGYGNCGVSWPVNVSNVSRKTDKKAFMKLLSGFGGCNAAMLFRKGGEM